VAWLRHRWIHQRLAGRIRRFAEVQSAFSRFTARIGCSSSCPHSTWTHDAYTVNGIAHVFRRAVQRAGIPTGDVSLHTLPHTALSRMIAAGIDTFTVMAISGHSSTDERAEDRRARVVCGGWAESGPNGKIRSEFE
jgi:integrase